MQARSRPLPRDVHARFVHELKTPPHTTVWLVEDSWLGFLIAMGVGAIAVIAGLAWRFVQQRRDDLAWKRHDETWASGGK